jgi:hypothetical protein
MLEMLNPEYRFSSLLMITPEWMRRHNFKVLLMDIDNTLLPRNNSVVPDNHLSWLRMMQNQGIAIVMASNNGGNRVASIERQLKEKGIAIPILTWAGKPFPPAYAGAIRLLEKTPIVKTNDLPRYSDCILAAGDQLFTDVLGAHWYNLPVALLHPLSSNDFIGTKVLRILEHCVIWYLKKQSIFPEEDNVNI